MDRLGRLTAMHGAASTKLNAWKAPDTGSFQYQGLVQALIGP
jgi:hypothetical protein